MLELWSYVRNRVHCHSAYALFDAWYPSKKLLKRIQDYGWSFVCRIKKNRQFNGKAVRHHRRHPSWTETGWLNGGIKVRVVRHGKQYSATNRLTFTAPEGRGLYRFRTQIEDVSSVGKDPGGLSSCRAHSLKAQAYHRTCCLIACCVLERERHDRGLSLY